MPNPKLREEISETDYLECLLKSSKYLVFCDDQCKSHDKIFIRYLADSLMQGESMGETEKTRKFKCYLCGQEFDSLTELAKHDLKLKHKREK